MHEKAQSTLEKLESLADAETGEAHRERAEFNEAAQVEQLKQAEAVVAAEVSTAEHPTLPTIVDDRPQLIDNVAKRLRMRQNLTTVQGKLKPLEKSFSKLVHQPLVQKVSESAGQTVARPSGILGGGITAFIGCLGYQILVRQYGLPYNFSFFILFFVAGFALGVLGELMLHKTHHKTV